MRLAGTEHPSRTSPSICPDEHGLIQAKNPGRYEKVLNIFAPGINHLTHLPDSVGVHWHFLISELHVVVKMLNSVLRHVLVELEWARIVALMELDIGKILLLGKTNHCCHENLQAYM